MISSKVKVLIVFFALFLFTSVVAAGCKQKSENSWVNTNSMPGHTFNGSINTNSSKHVKSTVIYLGSDGHTSNTDFGPRDVSFNFRDLR